jgi:hypothetical protein
MTRRRRLVRGAPIALAMVAAGAVAGVALATVVMTRQGSPERLRARTGSLVRAQTRPLPRAGSSRLEGLELQSSTGLGVHGLVRVPEIGRPPYAGVVLVGGIKRGSRIVTVAGLDAIARNAVIVSLDYPIQLGRASWRGVAALGTFARVRPAAFDTVSDVLLLTEYLSRRPDVDPSRIFLIGGSLGAVVAVVAGAVDARPAAVVLLYGGGDLGPLIAHTLEHPAQSIRLPRWATPLVGRAFAWWLTPLAPERFAPAIAPRTLIMVNGAADSLVPRRYVLALYDAAREPKELVWVEGEHVQPSEAALLERLSGVVTARLVAHGLLR